MHVNFDRLYESVIASEAMIVNEDIDITDPGKPVIGDDNEKKTDDNPSVPDYQYISAEYNKIQGEDGLFDQLEKALKKMGIYMYDTPSAKDMDVYGYVFSKKELSEDDLKAIDEDINSTGDLGVVEPEEDEDTEETEKEKLKKDEEKEDEESVENAELGSEMQEEK